MPAAAVQASQQGQFVFVVKSDQTVDARPVTVAWTDGDDAVIASGLKAGETVVTDGQLRLTPGARISIKTAREGGGRPRGSDQAMNLSGSSSAAGRDDAHSARRS